METLKSPYIGRVDERLAQARDACAASQIEEAIALVAEVIGRADDEADLVDAATLIPRPVDPLARARVHLLAAEAATRVRTPALRERIQAQLDATVDHFRPAEPLTPALMDQLVRAGDRPAVLDAIAAFAGEAATALDRSRLHLLLASQALIDGRFKATVGHVIVARSLSGAGSDAFYLEPVFRFAVARHTGEGLEGLVPVIREAVEKLPFAARGWLALALMASGHRPEVSGLWELLLAPRTDDVPVEAPEFLIATVGSAEVCAWFGDRTTAERLYDRLAPYAGRHAIAHAIGPYEGPVDLALGRLARVLGRSNLARDHLRRAATACRTIHAPIHEATALAELAQVESPGTRARAECVVTARAMADVLGMQPLLAQLDRLGSFSESGPLTPRESEIAELVATGLTNAQIARRLFLSERTVENHISRAMLKVGVASRTGLAATLRP